MQGPLLKPKDAAANLGFQLELDQPAPEEEQLAASEGRRPTKGPSWIALPI